MSLSRLGLSLGIGGGTSATSSGAPLAVAGGFNISIRDIEANILARTGDAVGTIAFGTDTTDFYVYNGASWEIYFND